MLGPRSAGAFPAVALQVNRAEDQRLQQPCTFRFEPWPLVDVYCTFNLKSYRNTFTLGWSPLNA